jgi:chromosome segregation ATPase
LKSKEQALEQERQ